jgi:hypothetical protein
MASGNRLSIEALEERIAPGAIGNPPVSSAPEVPAGARPQPNPGGAHGNPSTSATPEVPAGRNPQPR